MKDASADVPVSVADFHSVDHLGAVFLMGLVPGAKALPSVLHPGQTLSFQLRAYELVGEGIDAMGTRSPARRGLLGLHRRKRLIESFRFVEHLTAGRRL